MKDGEKESASAATRAGGYSIVITLAVIAIAVVLCMFTDMLPESTRVKDLSEHSMYELSDYTKEVMAALDKKVTITVIAKPTDVDVRINRILTVYASLSDRLKITTVDPVYNPTILENQSSDSVLVECADTGRSKTIAFSEIIKYNEYYQYYYGIDVEQEFDAEGQLTSAINYVASGNTHRSYVLSGHSEDSFAASVSDALSKLNISVEPLNLLSENGKVPDDCELLIVNAPQVDFAADELVSILEYTQKGGSLLFLYDYIESPTPNLNIFLRQYGVEPVEGYMMDFESNYYSPYYILPKLYIVEGISEDIVAEDRQILLAAPRGFSVSDALREKLTLTAFMTTTEQGALEPYQGAQNAEDIVLGSYALGVKITDDNTVNGQRADIMIIPSVLIDPQVLSTYGNLNNLHLFTNCVSSCIGAGDTEMIPAKSLSVSYNTVTGVGASFFSVLYVFIIPAAVLAASLAVWLRRRRR